MLFTTKAFAPQLTKRLLMNGMHFAALIFSKENPFMLRAALAFFIFGLIAILLGAYNVAGISLAIGKLLLYVFLALAVLSLIVSLITGKGHHTKPLP